MPDKKADKQEQEQRLQQNLAKIKHRWLVLSGKGGVGKSTVAVNLACTLADRGFRVGLLDTDIHGPDVLKMLGLEGQRLGGTGERVEPVKAYLRLKVVSMASLLVDPDTAVVWRGPLKMGAIRQFLSDVTWGEIDHLVVDSPPGTGDEPLSAAQLIGRADGAIIVTSPQEVALLDSRKCVNFAKQIGIPVAGIIENMSGMVCPHCNKTIELFGSGGGKRAAEELGVPFLGAIPVDPAIVLSGDQGKPFVHFNKGSQTALAFDAIVENIVGDGGAEKGEGQGDDSQTKDGKPMPRKVIAVASEDNRGLDGQVSAHFGRCPCYTVVEVEGDRVVAHRVEASPYYGQHQPGAVPQFIKSLGADVILSGGMGPKAVQMLQGFGMEVATGASGSVRQAVEGYLGGSLSGIVPCEEDHPEGCGHGHGGGQPAGDGGKKAGATEARRVAIPAVADSGLEAAMDPRFGRAPYYVVVDLQSGEVLETVTNTAVNQSHGAGIAAARAMGEHKIEAVVAGAFGPKANQALTGLGIELWTAPEGMTVGQVLEQLRSGALTRAG